jgi:hypothetical protein
MLEAHDSLLLLEHRLIPPQPIGSGAVHYFTDSAGSSFNYVSLGYPVTDLQFGSGQDFSVAFWTRFTGTPGNLPFLANSQNSYGDPGVTLAPSSGQGGWSWYLNDGSASANQGIGLLDPMGATLNDGQWHNLVYTFSRSGYATVYLDGTVANQTSIAAGADWSLDSFSVWNIGQASGNYAVDGQFDMDDLGIWRRALSAAEAEAIYIVGQDYGQSFDTYGPVILNVAAAGTNIDLSWQAGTLLQSTNVNSGYTPVPGATAPFYRTSHTNPATFFRVQQ